MKSPTSFDCARCGTPCRKIVYAKAPPYYCSRRCEAQSRFPEKVQLSCTICQKPILRIASHAGNTTTPCCSPACRNALKSRTMKGSGNPSYKCGKTKIRGYVKVRIDGKYYFEHRILMEQHLGRKLQPWESIHHINGIKDDNRIENLEVIHITRHLPDRHPLLTWGKRGATECSQCKTTEFPHKSHGLCKRCYEKSREKDYRRPESRSCNWCGTEYRPFKRDSKFCSKSCMSRSMWHERRS